MIQTAMDENHDNNDQGLNHAGRIKLEMLAFFVATGER